MGEEEYPFPDDSVRWYRFDFGADSLAPDTGSAEAPEADQVHRIAASALVGWVRRTRSFFSVRASSRRYGPACRIHREADGVTPEPRPLPDLLMYYVLQIAEGPTWQRSTRSITKSANCARRRLGN